MKYLKYIFSLLALLSLTLLMNCGGDDDPSPQQQLTNQLINNGTAWTIDGGSVTVDGAQPDADWSNFEVTFTDATFTTTGSPAPEVWPSSGTWSFPDETTTSQIVTGDGVIISLNVTDNTLNLSFVAPWGIQGRVTSIGGDYNFTLKSK
ncbi:MAG: hypothetical protein ACNS62_04075 [Candidatus Cyclobacteriaceae bacterium M3_2C_046]